MPLARTHRLALATTVAAGLVGGTLGLLPGTAAPAAAAGLVPYADCAELVRGTRERLRAQGLWGGSRVLRQEQTARGAAAVAAEAGAVPRSAGADALGGSVGRGGTGTNLQEQDVDEPDRVKLRDGHLAVLSRGRLTVVTASATPTVVSSLPLGDGQGDLEGGELLLSGERALVIGPEQPRALPAASAASPYAVVVEQPHRPRTRLVLVDLADPVAPAVLERATYDGAAVSARLVGATVRLVTSSTPAVTHAWPTSPAAEEVAARMDREALDRLDADDVVPQVERRDARGRVLERGAALSCSDVLRPRGHDGRTAARTVPARSAGTLLVTTLRPDAGLAPTGRTAVTADGDLVYASSDRLYVATSRWGAPAAGGAGGVTTEVHAFDTTAARTTRYVGSGAVGGSLLGRWAMSEHEGALRVATTHEADGPIGVAGPAGAETGVQRSSSSLAVLVERDGRLVERGRVDGLGVGERIQAVRYFGDLAAVVTFRQTDPLYLLDLSDEAAPRVLGELKVPGFSQYLHPLGDGLLLGLGQDADLDGRTTGLLLQVFDVRDLHRPRQVSRLRLGQGWSPAQDDSRAFGYDPARRLVTVPVQRFDQGAHALGVTVGRDGALRELGRLPGSAAAPFDRVLADGEHVYAVGPDRVVAAEAATLRRTGAVALP